MLNNTTTSDPASESDIKTEDEMDTSAEGKAHQPRKKQFYQQILKQLEFYLGDANLSKDRFLSKKLRENYQLPVELFLSFNKIRQLTNDSKDLVIAIKKSTILSLSEDESKVFRKTQIKRRDNQDDCTIYVENIPPDANHDWLESIFTSYGKVLYISIPKFKNKANKGFAFIEFDVAESVTKVLEAFGAAGCHLSTSMPCDQLLSVRTFEDDGGKALYNPGSKNPQELTLPLVPFLPASNEENKTGVALGKRKHIGSEQEDDSKKARKDEDPTEHKDDSSVPASEDTSMTVNEDASKTADEDASKTVDASVKSEVEMESSGGKDENAEVESDNDNNGEENNAKMHKNKKNHYLEVASLGLQILSKPEWKRLRNAYLNSQRQKMAQLKQRVCEMRLKNTEKELAEAAQTQDNVNGKSEAPNYNMVPGVILKIVPEQCVEDIKTFKVEAKAKSGVVYVDIVPDRVEVYIRCDSADNANNLLTADTWPNTSLLQGEEEQAYWQKINEDRSNKLDKKKGRGRGKLVHRAHNLHSKYPEEETVEPSATSSSSVPQCKHIRFDDNDDASEVTATNPEAQQEKVEESVDNAQQPPAEEPQPMEEAAKT